MAAFDFDGSSIVMKRNLWEVEAYDVLLILEGKKYII